MAAPSGTVTFLFTDIEGSTRLWQAAPDAMRLALERHDALVRAAIDNHDGHVFSTGGDGFGAAFARAGEAVAAALEAQAELAVALWPPDVSLRVRMGLHTGEVTERDGDYFGTAVNQAARLMAVGHGGQVLCSQVTAALVGADVQVVDLGDHRLRDLAAPMRVFQVGPGGFGPLRSLDVLPGNLPSLASSFVGRQAELAEVAKELGAHRLVTLTGVGGVGKTRLALQVAADLLPGYTDGGWLCELAAATNADEVAQVVAIALGVAQRPGMTLAGSTVDFLRPRQLLMVVDNCEHVLDAAADLAGAILTDAPRVRILATSREALGMPGEHIWPVKSLALPSDAKAAATSDAVVLFVERAMAADPGFVLDDTSTTSVIEVCRRLDRIPLAIELAAARAGSMGPAEIAGHLDERFRLLTGGRRGRVERHQTLRAAVEWSYSLLTDAERTVFDRLGVFPSSFDEAAAVTVCCGDTIERWDVIDALTSLVAKSMVGAERSGDTTRYQLLETLRHFARERAGAEVDGLRRRHATHYAAFAEEAGAALVSPDELEWQPRVAVELDNLRAATSWAFDATVSDDVNLGIRILGGLMMEAGLHPSSGIQGWASAALDLVEQLSPVDQSVVRAAAAMDAVLVGQLDRAKTLGASAVAEVQIPTHALLVALTALTMSTAMSGDPSRGMAIHTEGRRRLHTDEASDWLAGNMEIVASWLASMNGDRDTDRAEARQAVASARRAGAPSLLALALATLARAISDSDAAESLAAAEESIALTQAGAGDSGYGAALLVTALEREASGDRAAAAQAILTLTDYAVRTGIRAGSDHVKLAALILSSDPSCFEAAAALVGAANGPMLLSLTGLVHGDHQARYDRAVAEVARALGSDAFGTAERRGQSMAYDQIISLMLDQLAPLADAGSEL